MFFVTSPSTNLLLFLIHSLSISLAHTHTYNTQKQTQTAREALVENIRQVKQTIKPVVITKSTYVGQYTYSAVWVSIYISVTWIYWYSVFQPLPCVLVLKTVNLFQQARGQIRCALLSNRGPRGRLRRSHKDVTSLGTQHKRSHTTFSRLKPIETFLSEN